MTDDRPRRDRPALSRDSVITAALNLVDRDGLNKLTMRALGRELGVDPMAAYYHVPNKTALLDGVVEAVWAELELPGMTEDPWQDQLRESAWSILATLRRHPQALPIMASRPNISTAGLRMANHVLGLLDLAGLPPHQALTTLNAAGEFILGHALAETGALLPTGVAGDADLPSAYRSVVENGALPHLARALGAVDIGTVHGDDIFEVGIAHLIAGITSTPLARPE
jgi:TetR/AcrR family tetracycline transcriptional repressor